MKKEDFNLRRNFIALEKTVKESVNLTKWGLEFLNQASFADANQFYILYFLNTSLGFELLMKSMVCYKNYKDNGNFQVNLKGDYSHNLIELKDKITENYQVLSRETFPKQMAQLLEKDRDFISQDKEFNKILNALSEYGLGGRYYKLNFITSSLKNNQIDPESEMEKLIIELLDEKDENLRNKFIQAKAIEDDENLSNDTEVWQEVIQKYINPSLKYFLEVLARQFAYGVLGEEAMKCPGIHIIAYPSLEV